MAHDRPADMRLPLAVIGPVDVGRLQRELSALDEYLRQAAIRAPGESASLPRTSKLLEETATQNQCNLLVSAERGQLIRFLTELKQAAPVLHVSFAVDPSPTFLRKLVEYLRREIPPRMLIQLGLQPSIAAGCVVRTPDKYFDFSLRRHLADKRQLLIDAIGAQT